MHTFASANLQSTSLDDRVAPRSFGFLMEEEEEDGAGANLEAKYAWPCCRFLRVSGDGESRDREASMPILSP